MALTNKDIYEAAIAEIDSRKYGFDLWYVHHDDRLMDEQVEAVIKGDIDSVYMDVAEAFSEQHYTLAVEDTTEIVKSVIAEAARDDESIDEEDAWWEFEYSPLFDEVRFKVEDRAEGDPVKDLAGQTPDPLVQYVPDIPIEVDLSGVYGEAEEDDEWKVQVDDVLRGLGLPVTEHNVQALRDGLDECHDYASIRAIFTVDLAELVDRSVKWIRVTSPSLLCLNNFDGSGMDTAPMEGTIMVPRDQIRLDSALGYGSWDSIAGVVRSAYTVGTEYVRLCEYEFEGTDTDGTDFYRCTSHGSSEPSPEAHCGKATEPAYAMLVTGKEAVCECGYYPDVHLASDHEMETI